MHKESDKQLIRVILIMTFIFAVLALDSILLHNILPESFEFVRRYSPISNIVVIGNNASLFAYGNVVYEISGPTDNKYYKNDIIGGENLKVIQKKEFPGNIKGSTYWSEDGDQIHKRGLAFICEGVPKDFLVVLQTAIEDYENNYENYEFQIIQTTFIDKSKWIEFRPTEELLIQTENKRTLNYYDLKGKLLKAIINDKPFVIEKQDILYSNDQYIFDGSTLLKILNDGFEKILDIKPSNNINNAFIFETYDNSNIIMLYDGRYLHKINTKERKVDFSVRVADLRQGFAGSYYCIAPFKEGICVINIKEGTYETLLQSDLNYRFATYNTSATYLSSLIIFASQHNDIVDLKAWRIGPDKEYIKNVPFSTLPQIKGIYSSIFIWNNYLCIISGKDVYFTKYQLRGWRDIWEENQR